MKKISPSQLKLYLRCPRQYEFRYIQGLRLAPGGSLVKGLAAHKAAEANLANKIVSGEDLPVEAIQDLTSDEFERLRLTAEFQADENPGALKDAAVRSAVAWRNKVAPGINPAAVETWVEAPTPEGNVVFGRLDCEEVDGTIRDMKNTSRLPAANALAVDVQAMGYCYMQGGAAPVQFDYLVEQGRTITYAPRTAQFTATDMVDFAKTVDGVARAVEAGAFPQNRDGWWCSSKWCGYWPKCRGR